jgi:hypothetical protein
MRQTICDVCGNIIPKNKIEVVDCVINGVTFSDTFNLRTEITAGYMDMKFDVCLKCLKAITEKAIEQEVKP